MFLAAEFMAYEGIKKIEEDEEVEKSIQNRD